MRIVLPGAETRFIEAITHGGAFLSVGGPRPNTMTIGWGSIGDFWNRDVMTVAVRPSRFTHEILEREGEFTVSVPAADRPLSRELRFAGTVSGRDEDKFRGHGLTAAPAKSVGAPIVGECALHFECRVLCRTEMDHMAPGVLPRFYPDGDLHTLYLAEVVACYETK